MLTYLIRSISLKISALKILNYFLFFRGELCAFRCLDCFSRPCGPSNPSF